MANKHQHGAFGAHLIANRDLTPHTSAMSLTLSRDAFEDTSLSPLGQSKTFLQGLGGSAGSSSGYAMNDYEFLTTEMATLTGNLREVEPVTYGWFGLALGKFLTMARSRKTTYNIPVSNASTITTSINHQGDGIYYHGFSLLNPFGFSAFTGSETQLITFTATPAAQNLALHFAGYTDTFEFLPTDSNATLKAGIEGLLDLIPGLSAITATVTGSLTGTGTKTGTKSIAFSGNVNIPELTVVTAPVQTVTVSGAGTGAADGDYVATGNTVNGAESYNKPGTDYWIALANTPGPWTIFIMGPPGTLPASTGSSGWTPLYQQNSNNAAPGDAAFDNPANHGGANPEPTVTGPALGASGVADTVVILNLAQGGTSPAKWNLLTATGSGTAHDGGATTATGFYCRLQVLLAAGTAFTVVVEHSDSSSSGFSALHSFAGVTDASNPALVVQEYSGASNLSVKRYVRYRITTITGTFAAFVGYARKS